MGGKSGEWKIKGRKSGEWKDIKGNARLLKGGEVNLVNAWLREGKSGECKKREVIWWIQGNK